MYVIDNQTHPVCLVPNLIICKGVGNHTPSNRLLINHLRILACQTYCIVLKIDPAGGMDWQAKRHKETGLALIPGVDQYEVIIIFPSVRDTGG